VKAAGPLGKVIEADSTRINPGRDYPDRFTFGSGANSLIMMNRIAFFDDRKDELDAEGQSALLRWADKNQLGQHSELLGWFTARRNVALTELSRQGLTVRRFRAEPEWRLAAGLGNKANPYEIGLSLHGTYGWPVIPATSLKGLAAAWAVASGAGHRDVRRVLGTPRLDVPPAPALKYNPDDSERLAGEPPAARGTVCFLDAIPAAKPVDVQLDVLTPHVKPYYDDIATGKNPPRPPAEYHNPVPVKFLTVRGTFAVDLYGEDPDDVDLAAGWLTEAASELGAGGKTAAGYGYLIMTPVPDGAGSS
jgi:CRISPR type III-B/RAMP module RAMP protein Cmr6